jgi:DNA-binding IclR family transcriptional regulator
LSSDGDVCLDSPEINGESEQVLDQQTDERDRSVLGRAVGVLDAFANAEGPELSLTELADRAELPLTTTHRLAGQLVNERLLERLPSGRFRIGPHVQELVSLAPREVAPQDVSHPYLQDLSDVTGQPVQLVVLEGTDTVIVDRTGGAPAGRGPDRLPAHASCSGLVLLASAPKPVADAVLDGPLERRWDGTPGAVAKVRAAVEVARRQGHLELRSNQAGTVSVAAPIVVGEDVVGAVGINNAPGSPRSLAPVVLTTARSIARAMGAPPTGAISIVR